jgi:2-iminobutanoate/2-iminopropanoate deaminase
MERIETPRAPRPGGHYSQAVVHGGIVYAAGQLPVDPATGQMCGGPVEDHARQAVANLRAVLEAAGSALDLTLKVTVYVSDIALWGRVNAVYAEAFGAHRPARTVVPTRDLHHGALVEIDAIAALRDVSGRR